MLLQKKSGDGQEFLSRKKLSRKKLSIFVSKVGPATGVTRTNERSEKEKKTYIFPTNFLMIFDVVYE